MISFAFGSQREPRQYEGHNTPLGYYTDAAK